MILVAYKSDVHPVVVELCVGQLELALPQHVPSSE